jgi:phosphatidylinositol alpha-1,6-mannosyltransferase
MRRIDHPHDWRDAVNIVISQDFLPKIGGAHAWLYESYRRWESPVSVLTKSYSEDAWTAQSELEFDRRSHDSINIFREITPPGELGLLNPSCLKSYVLQLRSIHRLAGPKPVILHCLRAFPDGFGGALYRHLSPRSARLVVYAHGEEVLIANTSRQLRFMARCAYRTADLIIANSESTRRLVEQLCPGCRIVCVHPGVDPVSFQISAGEVAKYRASWGWPADTVVLSTIGRMEPRKNHRMVLMALGKLRSEGLPLALVCAGEGEGEERVHLGEMAASMGLQDWSRFPGAIPENEKRLLFAASDIYAMPSIEAGGMIEGFGIVFLEAAAAGIPSVCGNTGGQPEAVLDMETGIVVDGQDLNAVASAVRNLVINPGLRRHMGQRGRVWAAEHAWESVVERTREAIHDTLHRTMR